MRDECLKELVENLYPEARAILRVFAEMTERGDREVRVETLIQASGMTTHQVRKALWGLQGAGLVIRSTFFHLTGNGRRAIRFL